MSDKICYIVINVNVDSHYSTHVMGVFKNKHDAIEYVVDWFSDYDLDSDEINSYGDNRYNYKYNYHSKEESFSISERIRNILIHTDEFTYLDIYKIEYHRIK